MKESQSPICSAIKSEVHQMVGHFSGYVKTQDGEVIEINRMLGCSEEHYAKW